MTVRQRSRKPRPDCFPVHRRIHFPFCDSFGSTNGVPSRTLATVREFYFTGPVENGRRYQPLARRQEAIRPALGN
jgi:hypothetical protein